ncbi:MAG: hypothetical protein CBC47_04515 [Alphaproteobacteria bacterium TMED87]|nr:hypothetical protein [Rhodospirillaceae bacterium]OUV09759.1 MAG: hypothetical protein CBC47_04515 [Alphaproteobacteria bacterium TMED87]
MSSNKFRSNSAMLAGFSAIWLAVIANETSHLFMPENSLNENAQGEETFGYPIEVPEGFGAGVLEESLEPVLIDIKPLLALASVEQGMKVARKCQSCHSFDKGGKNGTGPNLHNIVGAVVSEKNRGGYKLSASLMSGVDIWTYDNLNAYLENPKSLAPQGNMNFAGLRKPKDRANIIKFLMDKTEEPPEVLLDEINKAEEGS